jgi:NACHT domain- and WD repeat-containing protein
MYVHGLQTDLAAARSGGRGGGAPVGTELIFRVFVSSPFVDMVAERNALQERVFPELETYCRNRGARFQAVDLRWGVPPAASLSHQTLAICLREIDRCRRITPRPNFIVLLGDRYGWRPVPHTIPAEDFESLARETRPDDLEVLREWYRLDTNAVPHEYRLRPLGIAAVSGESPPEAAGPTHGLRQWEEHGAVELRRILGRAAELAWPDPFERRRLRCTASATHLEIMQGVLSGPGRHAFAYLRSFDSLPHRTDGKAATYADYHTNGARDDKLRLLQANLKSELEGVLGPVGHIYHYRADFATWPDTDALASRDSPFGLSDELDECLDAMCHRVRRDLTAAIDEELRAVERSPASDREAARHLQFAQVVANPLIGQQDTLAKIREYLVGPNSNVMVLTGGAGMGKTAVMSAAVRESLINRGRNGPTRTLARFVGLSPESSKLQPLLAGLCRELAEFIPHETPVPTDVRDIVLDFYRRLGGASADRPIHIFLDGLDQLSDQDRSLGLVWIPETLPPFVRIVASVSENFSSSSDFMIGGSRVIPSAEILPVPQLQSMHADLLFDQWLSADGRRLTPSQRRIVMDGFASDGTPMYLWLAVEAAKRWASFDQVDSLPGDVAGLLEQLFDRLEHHAAHEPELVRTVVSLLVSARHGLAEDELLGALANDPDFFPGFIARAKHRIPAGRFPIAVWLRLYSDLQPYLADREADEVLVLATGHRRFTEVAAARYTQASNKAGVHAKLAAYFAGSTGRHSQPWQFVDPNGGKRPNHRKLSELPYHLREAGDWEGVWQLLADYDFLETKAESGRIFELHEDFVAAVAGIPADNSHRNALVLAEAAVRTDIHFLSLHTTSLFECFWNSCTPDATGEISHRLELWRAARDSRSPRSAWVRAVRPLTPGSRSRWILRGHQCPVQAVAFSPDGETLFSGSAYFEPQTLVMGLPWNPELQVMYNSGSGLQPIHVAPNRNPYSRVDNSVRVWSLSLTFLETAKQI